MVAVLGGTFAVIHSGHMLLFAEAASTGEKVVIGLSTDEFVRTRKSYKVPPYKSREESLSKVLNGILADFEIKPLDAWSGNTTTEKEYSRLIVSPETYAAARRINDARVASGLNPLEIRVVPFAIAQDMLPISSRRILAGDIDGNGKRLRPLRIVVSSKNVHKVDSVRKFFGKMVTEVEVASNHSYTIESNQPYSSDTLIFAEKRARSASGNYDYSVGIESGLIMMGTKAYDFHACVVLDSTGVVTSGFSSGFQVPNDLVGLTKHGLDLSASYQKMHGSADIGSSGGIVSVISKGTLKRTDLIYESIRNAFVPRFRPEMYLERM